MSLLKRSVAAALVMIAAAGNAEGSDSAGTLPGWMAGVWLAELPDGSWAEEWWTPARGGVMLGAGRSGKGEAVEDALEPTDWRLSDEAPILVAQKREELRTLDEKIREAEILTAQRVAERRQYKAKIEKELLNLRRENPVDDWDKQRIASFEVLTKQQLREAEKALLEVERRGTELVEFLRESKAWIEKDLQDYQEVEDRRRRR